MHPFPPGARVETNQKYFELFDRKAKGVSVAIESLPLPPSKITFVR